MREQQEPLLQIIKHEQYIYNSCKTCQVKQELLWRKPLHAVVSMSQFIVSQSKGLQNILFRNDKYCEPITFKL